MKLLNIAQMSQEELYCNCKYDSKTGKYSSRKFNDIAKKFPHCLVEITNNYMESNGPRWGYAWYKKNEKGEITLFRENWDTSG